VSRGSVVSISVSGGAGRSGDRMPVRARSSAPVRTEPGDHPVLCNGSFLGVRRPAGYRVMFTFDFIKVVKYVGNDVGWIHLTQDRPVADCCERR
jgi:hypothetical protein